jgi:hypothetical protein
VTVASSYYPIGTIELPGGSRAYEFSLHPGPLYQSWEDYLKHTTDSSRRAWLARKLSRANRPRLLGGRPPGRVRLADVVALFEAARGSCTQCGNLAVESIPVGPDGAVIAWGLLRRRIGTIDHRVPVLAGGSNHRDNLQWCCFECNNLHPSGPMSIRVAAQDDGPLFGLPAIPVGERRCKRCTAAAVFRVYEPEDGSWTPRRGVVYCQRCFRARIPAPGGAIVQADGSRLTTPDGWWGV